MQIPSGTFLRTPVPEDQLCGQRGPALETQCPLDLGHSSSVTAAGGSALSGRSCWACCLPLGPQSGWLLMVRGLGEGWHPHASSSVGSSCQAPFIGTQLALLCIQFSNADRRGQGAAGCLRRGGPLVAWEPPSRHPSPAHKAACWRGLPQCLACALGADTFRGPGCSPGVSGALSPPSGEVKTPSSLPNSSCCELETFLLSREPSLEVQPVGLAAGGSINTGGSGVPILVQALCRGPAGEPARWGGHVHECAYMCVRMGMCPVHLSVHTCAHTLVCMCVCVQSSGQGRLNDAQAEGLGWLAEVPAQLCT